MAIVEPTSIGLSQATHQKLRRLKEDGHFDDMVDAYRFGIGLAIASGVIPPPISSTQTVFAVSGVDPDHKIRTAIVAVYGDQLEGQSVYRFAERLADWGVQEIYMESEKGDIDVAAMLTGVPQDVS